MKVRNLTELEREIIAAATLEEDLSVARLARTLKHREYSVRDSLERLIAEGVLRRVWLVDVLQLGFLRFQILLSIGARKKLERQAIQDYLVENSRIPFVADLGGAYDYEFVVLCRNPSQVRSVLNELSELSSRPYHQKDISIQDSLHIFNRKHFSKRPSTKQITLGQKVSRHPFDERDHEILKALQENPLATKRELGRIAGVSEVTVATRMKALTLRKIIAGSAVRVNGSLLGLNNAKLLVRAKQISPENSRKLLSFAASHPLVTNFRECLANNDFEIGVEYREPLQLKQLKEDLLDRFESFIQSIEVLPRFQVQKYRMYPFQTFREFEAS